LDFRKFEHRVILAARYLTLVAVLGSSVGALLMLGLGSLDIVIAVREFGIDTQAEGMFGRQSLAVIAVVEALDRFLIALVLIYFGYGVYSLFIRGNPDDESVPQWLHVHQMGQLKQVIAELIIVVLFVLFLRVALKSFGHADTPGTWLQAFRILLLPLCIALLALSLKLVQLHPKRIRIPDSSP
jgi:uncharacterized membrane protein YqhA